MKNDDAIMEQACARGQLPITMAPCHSNHPLPITSINPTLPQRPW
ncbi:hypothetical protein MELB17_02060 [Marinobacter sp. ELB17]|nr:hypothetical protein MELB17_02060 [Marinobacter sp. ELB17]